MDERVEVLGNIYDYMINLEASLKDKYEEITEKYSFDGLDDAVEGIGICFQGLNATEDIHGINMAEYNIAQNLAELADAMKNSDFWYASDIIRYEFLPKIGIWLDVLDDFYSQQ